MNTCSCGKLVDERSTQCPRCAALQVLGLETDTTETEIRSAYRLLVKTWQPDRFQGDEKLKQAAGEKLKEINSAFEVLTSTSIQRGMPDRPQHEDPYRAFQQAQPIAEAAGKKAAPTVAQPIPAEAAATVAAPVAVAASAAIPNAIPPAPPTEGWQKIKLFYRKTRLLFLIAAIAFVLLTGRSIWTVFKVHDAAREQAAKAGASGKESAPNAPEAPKKSFLESVEQQLQRLAPSSSAPLAAPQAVQPPPQAAPPAPQAAQPASQGAESSEAEKTRAAYRLTLPAPRNPDSRSPEKTNAATQKAPAAPRHVLLPYLTVGSTKAEVLAQQGTPTASSEDKLVYGKSELYLKNGAVVGWRIDPSSPIRVKLWPEAAVDPGLDFFSYGSSKDSVLVVQGTPTAFTENKFEYGGSVVYFQNNRVYSWKNDPASIPLRAR